MARLSERLGLREVRTAIQSDSLDQGARVALWNTFRSTLSRISTESYQVTGYHADTQLLRDLWANELEKPIDEYKENVALGYIKSRFLDDDWWHALDITQWMLEAVGRHWSRASTDYRVGIASDLTKYVIGFRILNDEVVPVTSAIEVEAIERAMATGTVARTHLERANSLLANRDDPQYAKVVHEAINAVESVVAELTGEKVLSVGLKKLKGIGVPIHPALIGGWDKMYGYASDASGIRHGLVRDEDVDEPLAVYFLVSCSAFVNLLVKASSRGG